MERRRFKQTQSLDRRLTDHAARLREEANKCASNADRERLIRAARQTEAAAHINDWLTSPELQPPK